MKGWNRIYDNNKIVNQVFVWKQKFQQSRKSSKLNFRVKEILNFDKAYLTKPKSKIFSLFTENTKYCLKFQKNVQY